jgi:hypothetical protein
MSIDELKQFEDSIFISVIEFTKIAQALETKYKDLNIQDRVKQAKKDFILIKRVEDDLQYAICEQKENKIQVVK